MVFRNFFRTRMSLSWSRRCTVLLTSNAARIHSTNSHKSNDAYPGTPFLTTLAQKLPSFPVNAHDVCIIQHPETFHQTLLEMISRAKKKIFISSLYIGFEERELFQAIHGALSRNKSLTVDILVDKLRSTRPGNDSPVLKLVDLVKAYPDRVRVHLFKPPGLKLPLEWIVPRRYDEGWGTWHVKCYGVDDEVIISGANLNRSYFTNRQDRYIHFRNQPELAIYCSSFLKLFSGYSFRLEPSDTEAYRLSSPSHSHRPAQLTSEVAKKLRDFQETNRVSSNLRDNADTVVFPFVQSGSFGIRQEHDVLTNLFASVTSPTRPMIHLTSGYFALHEPYQDMLITADVDCKVLAAGPKANGFYKSKGFSSLIPEGYTLMEKSFWSRVVAAGRSPSKSQHGISLHEWSRDGWTYHAKGIWVSDSLQANPYLTIFGSSNLNARSANLDVELGFVMYTRAEKLRGHLRKEMEALYESQPAVSFETWRAPERRVRPLAWLLVQLGVANML